VQVATLPVKVQPRKRVNMPSVNEEFIHLRSRLTVFENACLKAVGELTKPNPQIGPALLHIQGALMANDRIIKQFNRITHKG
jgi:hypothetical protein